MNKRWEYKKADEEKVNKIVEEYKVSNLLAKILVNKDITTKDKIELFLNPTRHDFYDPFLMPDMESAVNRIIKAIGEKEKILIYGDYDVDGITSTTVLKRFFEDRGIDVSFYIPNRLDEGYGLNKDAIKKVVDAGNTLMITVDCGITGNEEIDYRKFFRTRYNCNRSP